MQRAADLLQHALHFLEAKHDALDEDHHAPREEDPPAAPIAVSLGLNFAFCRFEVESFTVLAQATRPAACTCTALMP